MMHCKPKPPEVGPTDEVANTVLCTVAAAAGIRSKYQCHWRHYGREDRKTVAKRGTEHEAGSLYEQVQHFA